MPGPGAGGETVAPGGGRRPCLWRPVSVVGAAAAVELLGRRVLVGGLSQDAAEGLRRHLPVDGRWDSGHPCHDDDVSRADRLAVDAAVISLRPPPGHKLAVRAEPHILVGWLNPLHAVDFKLHIGSEPFWQI